jgi:hypothetical protein
MGFKPAKTPGLPAQKVPVSLPDPDGRIRIDGNPRVSPGWAGLIRAGRSMPRTGVPIWPCPIALTSGKSRVSTLMHFPQIGQTIHRQLLGVPLPGSPEDFEISADFQPGICKPLGIKGTYRLVLVQNVINHLNHRKLRNKRAHCNSCSAAVWISDVKPLRQPLRSRR